MPRIFPLPSLRYRRSGDRGVQFNLALILAVLVLLSGCHAGDRRRLAETRVVAVQTKQQIVDYLNAGDCPNAITTMNSGVYGIGLFFRAHVYEACGDIEAAIDSLLPAHPNDQRALAPLEALRLFDLTDRPVRENDSFFQRVMAQTMHFSESITEYKDGPRRWNTDHLVFYSLLNRMPMKQSFEHDIGFLQWQLEAVQPYRVRGYFEGDGSDEYAPFYGVALLPEEQAWRAARYQRLRAELLRILERREEQLSKLWSLQVAYFMRLRPWLEQCSFAYLELEGVNVDEEEHWTCNHEYFGATGHCLIERPGVSSISIRFGSSVTQTTEFNFAPRMGGMRLIKSKVLGESFGTTPTGYSRSTRWTPTVVEIDAAVDRLGLTGLPPVEPVPANCNLDTWNAHRSGPPSTAFTEWFDEQRQKGKFHPWKYNPQTRYSLLRCKQPESEPAEEDESCQPLLDD